MKKWLFALALLLVVVIVSTLLFIPQNIRVSDVRLMKASRDAALRNLHEQADWIKWWQKNKPTDTGNFHAIINDYLFTIKHKFYNGVELNISNGDRVYNGKITLVPFSDSIALQCEANLLTNLNPINKIVTYREAVKLKACFGVILDSLKSYNESPFKVYNLNIHRTTLKDTSLIAIKVTTNDSPSTRVIYSLVDSLKHYIAANKATETNLPILNVQKLEGGGFTTMVAIATDKPLPNSASFSYKRMIPYKDKILVANITGGPSTVQRAYYEIERYMTDHQLSAPVIPFEYLVTDRWKESDTSKWVTTIYVPIR